MKTLSVVKMSKGYYVTKLWYNRNMGSQWCKTKTAVDKIRREWVGK